MNDLDYKLNKMKEEIAAEFGIPNYNSLNKGELTARQNGQIGGEMVKRLVALGKQQLMMKDQTPFVPKVIEGGIAEKEEIMLPLDVLSYFPHEYLA